jgi:putative flippase GtrA
MKTESPVDGLLHRVRIGKFVSVGAVGAVIETIVVVLLTTTLGTGALAAKAVGAELSVSTMFVINDRWTFYNKGSIGGVAFVRRWIKSHLVRVVGLSVAFLTLYILTSTVQLSLSILGVDFWPTVANLLGIGVGMVFNYVAESLFTWKVG